MQAGADGGSPAKLADDSPTACGAGATTRTIDGSPEAAAANSLDALLLTQAQQEAALLREELATEQRDAQVGRVLAHSHAGRLAHALHAWALAATAMAGEYY